MAENLDKYTEKDYEGEFNLKQAEKDLILEAAEKFPRNRRKMASALKVTPRSLYIKLIRHGLSNTV